MAGSAMLAIAVSSDAIASAVKIAAAAQRRRSVGRPSNAASRFSGTAISATSDTFGEFRIGLMRLRYFADVLPGRHILQGPICIRHMRCLALVRGRGIDSFPLARGY